MKTHTPTKMRKEHAHQHSHHHLPARRQENPFETLHKRMNQLFEGFMGGMDMGMGMGMPMLRDWPSQAGRWEQLSPRFDITESGDGYHVEAELPGMDEKDIDVKMDNHILTIKGEKTEESEKKGRDYLLSERSYGSFQRSFSMPDGVDASKIRASFKKGVLSICLPKTEKGRQHSKKIEVNGK